MKKIKILGLMLCLVLGMAALAACGASKEHQGIYSNTNWSDIYNPSYINVTGEHSCDLAMVYTTQKKVNGQGIYLVGKGHRFDASSDGKYVYLELTDGTSIKADFNTSTKTITHAGYSYKK